jgi:hypothetical protein
MPWAPGWPAPTAVHQHWIGSINAQLPHVGAMACGGSGGPKTKRLTTRSDGALRVVKLATERSGRDCDLFTGRALLKPK